MTQLTIPGNVVLTVANASFGIINATSLYNYTMADIYSPPAKKIMQEANNELIVDALLSWFKG